VKSLFGRLFRVPRWVSFPVVVGVVVGLTAVVYPGGLSAAYADFRDAGPLQASLDESSVTDRHLSTKIGEVRDRMDYKDELITALVHGDLSLTAVTDEFAQMNRGNERMLNLQRMRYGDVGETELAARNVLELTRVHLSADGGSSVVMTRLQAEYQERFGHPAPLPL
jgi:hypothetical protein